MSLQSAREPQAFFLFRISFFLFASMLLATSAKTIYIDSDDQKTMPVVVSQEQVRMIQSQMLNVLGLRRPSQNAHAPNEFVSRYMAALYRTLDQNNEVAFNPSFKYLDKNTDVANVDFNKVMASASEINSIVAFMPEQVILGPVEASEKTQLELLFDEDDDSLNDDSQRLSHAELYVALEDPSIASDAVHVFHEHDGNLRELAPARTDRFNGTQMVAVNITQVVLGWLDDEEDSEWKLVVRIHDSDGTLLPVEPLAPRVHCFGIGFSVESHEPSSSRSRRSVPSENDLPEDEETAADGDASASGPESTPNSGRSLDIIARPIDRCRVRMLYIGFEEIGWGEFVIAPEGYSANYCDGGCSFPLDVKQNPSNHATMQTLVHVMDKNKTGEALCAPTKMAQPLSFLFFDDNAVRIRKYEEMTVTDCGCQ